MFNSEGPPTGIGIPTRLTLSTGAPGCMRHKWVALGTVRVFRTRARPAADATRSRPRPVSRCRPKENTSCRTACTAESGSSSRLRTRHMIPSNRGFDRASLRSRSSMRLRREGKDFLFHLLGLDASAALHCVEEGTVRHDLVPQVRTCRHPWWRRWP